MSDIETPIVAEEPVVAETQYTNLELEQLMSANRAILSQTQAEADALDSELIQQTSDVRAKLDEAIASEREEEALLVAQKQSFDVAVLEARIEHYKGTETDFDVAMDEYQKKVMSNNKLATEVLAHFTSNVSKIGEVKSQMKALKGKLDRFSAIIDACNGKK